LIDFEWTADPHFKRTAEGRETMPTDAVTLAYPGGSNVKRRTLRLLGVTGLIVFGLAAFTPLAGLVNARMGGSPRVEPAQAIVVLGRGGADYDGVLTNASLRRMIHGVTLFRGGLAPLLILSGTSPEIGARSELARGFGVPSDRLLPVPGAHTTREEATGLARLLLPRGIRRVLVVADPVDMPRARRVLERAGFTVLAAPTEASSPTDPEARLALLRDLTIELGGLLYYRLIGSL
jgi:uncharacterized SAM-binding protein YcdF (DUF218 family)